MCCGGNRLAVSLYPLMQHLGNNGGPFHEIPLFFLLVCQNLPVIAFPGVDIRSPQVNLLNVDVHKTLKHIQEFQENILKQLSVPFTWL